MVAALGLERGCRSLEAAACSAARAKSGLCWAAHFRGNSMTTSTSDKQFPIPAALPAILKGFARETLRAQVRILTFVARLVIGMTAIV